MEIEILQSRINVYKKVKDATDGNHIWRHVSSIKEQKSVIQSRKYPPDGYILNHEVEKTTKQIKNRKAVALDGIETALINYYMNTE